MAQHRQPRTMPAEDKIETEGNFQMKEVLRKQMKTDVTLEEHLSQVKTFSHGTIHNMPSDALVGQVSLEEFSRLMEKDQQREELRHFGLTEEEILLKLEHDAHLASTSTRQQCDTRPFTDTKRLENIDKKIALKVDELSQPTKFAGAKALSRHEMDLERAVTRDRDSSKLFNCLITNKSVDSIDPDHPINHLDEILGDVLSKTQRRKRKRKLKDRNNVEDTKRITVSNPTDKDADNCSLVRETIDTDVNLMHQELASDPTAGTGCLKSVSLCQEPASSPTAGTSCLISVDSSGTKKLADRVESIPTEVIKRYRLSVAAIRQLPRFKDYDPGDPSPVLYLKNLSPRVTEEDLVALFVRFQKPNTSSILFRLLHGRMKGQAFVTFDSAETATAALQLVNGYDFKGKPIIITYGRHSMQEHTCKS